MNADSDEVHSRSGIVINQFLDKVSNVPESWSEADLRSMWRHQLDGPALTDWNDDESTSARTLESSVNFLSLRDLFEAAHPDLDMLRSVKAQAKVMGKEQSDLMPPAIFKAVYYVSIAVAIAREGELITSFSVVQLKKGFAWMAQQSWLDDSSQNTIIQATDSLSDD